MTDIVDRLFDPPVGQCGRCQRRTWDPEQVGQEDRMPQPDGYPCGGRIEPLRGVGVGSQ